MYGSCVLEVVVRKSFRELQPVSQDSYLPAGFSFMSVSNSVNCLVTFFAL